MQMKQNLIVVKSVIEVWSLLFLRYLVILLVYLPVKIKAALVNSLVKVLLNCPRPPMYLLTFIQTNLPVCLRELQVIDARRPLIPLKHVLQVISVQQKDKLPALR